VDYRTKEEGYQEYIRQGKIQTGADDGCLHCIDLVNYGKSRKKHRNGCPCAFETNDHIMLPNDIKLGSVPNTHTMEAQDNIEAHENAALGAASAISFKKAAIDVVLSASHAVADEGQNSTGVKHKHQDMDDMLLLSSTVEVKRKIMEEAKGEHISSTLEVKGNIIDESYSVERWVCEDISADLDDNRISLSEVQDFLELSHFDPDEYNIEDSIVFMYKTSLLHTSNGNYSTGKAPPLVRSDEENTNVIAYFQAVVQSKGSQKLLNRWLTREEAIEVIYVVTFCVFEWK
jgi:hypothetical protein